MATEEAGEQAVLQIAARERGKFRKMTLGSKRAISSFILGFH